MSLSTTRVQTLQYESQLPPNLKSLETNNFKMATLEREHSDSQDIAPPKSTDHFIGQALLDALVSDPLPSPIPHDGGVLLLRKTSSGSRGSSSSSPGPADGPRPKVLPPWRQDSLKRILIWRQWQINHTERDQYPNPSPPPATAHTSITNDSKKVQGVKTPAPNPYSGCQETAVKKLGK